MSMDSVVHELSSTLKKLAGTTNLGNSRVVELLTHWASSSLVGKKNGCWLSAVEVALRTEGHSDRFPLHQLQGLVNIVTAA